MDSVFLSSTLGLFVPLVVVVLLLRRRRRRRLIPASSLSNAVSMSSSTTTAMLWSDMNKDIFEEIMKHLTIGDIIRCGAVCKSWRSFRPPLPTQLPWLVLPYAENGNTNIRGFFSLSDNRSYNIELPERSPNQDCRGSSYGWLFLVEPTTIFLFNPLSRKKIELPPLTSLDCVADYDPKQVGEEFVLFRGRGVIEVRSAEYVCSTLIRKAFLSSDPCSGGDFIILAILQKEGIAYCHPGEKSWNVFGLDEEELHDIACYNGRLYTITSLGRLLLINIDPPATLSYVTYLPLDYMNSEIYYLVESAGDLLLVTRPRDFEEDYKTCFFDVYRLESDNGEMKWIEVMRLVDRVLFLGKNHSFSLSVSKYPGCKESSIYFTDDDDEGKLRYFIGGHDIGVYTFKDDEYVIRPLPFYQPDVKYIRHSPFWMIPDQC